MRDEKGRFIKGHKSVGSFKKGNIPWNKGLHIALNDRFLTNNDFGTRFKKGHKFTPEQKEKRLNSMKWYYEKGHEVSAATRLKIADSKRGSKSHFWKGGINNKRDTFRNSVEYSLWRTSIFERDKYTCKECGAKNGEGKSVVLQADHIRPFSVFPEYALDVDNGMTLCIDCHRKTPTYGGRMYNYK